MTSLLRKLARVLGLVTGLSLAATAPAMAQLGGEPRADVQLVADQAQVAPGMTFYAAMQMDMQPGWHVYWQNAGDAGLPPRLIVEETSSVPADAIGEFLWPLPELLLVAEDQIMDYGYTRRVVLPFPITVPQDATGTFRLDVEADYLICETICIPETAFVSLILPVGPAREDAAGGGLIGEWIQKVPTAFAGEAAFDASEAPWTLSLKLPGGFPDGAQIRYFPFQHEIRHVAAQPQRVGPEGASLRLTPSRSGMVPETLAGVIRVDAPGAEPVGFEIFAAQGAVFPGTDDTDVVPARAALAPEVIGLGHLMVLAGLALLGGVILNLMPCVLPVLSMKAIGMVQAAATGHAGEVRAHGLWYTAGVIVSFLALAGVILAIRTPAEALTLGFQMQNAPTVAILTLVMFAVGLWLMGFFELGLSIQNTGSGLASRGGAMGAFFTGVLAAVVGAPCVGPFLAVALGAVMTQPAPAVIAVFFAMGLGMALPFLILSFVPGLHRLLPKPGSWMETLKQAFAFPMFLTAAWLLSVLVSLAGAAAAGWTVAGATALVFAVWLARQGGGVRRAVAAVALAAGFIYPAMQANVPAPAVAGSGEALFDGSYGEAAWSPELVDSLIAEGRPVFVDFTASWCASCQVNKMTTLKTRRVREAFEAADVAFLVADFTQKDPVIAAELQRRGRAGVPMYLWYPAGESEPQILPELLSQDLVLGLLTGR
ncbi:protein-disulfide reductase DsbD family protein [Hyphomonas sp.]|uniref:protein-disulfide reductase DsbD family protein n=1 Tax=Hyphomonas sp. TaxID=87 RepID=UPI00391D19CC